MLSLAEAQESKMMENIRKIQEKYAPQLLKHKGVVGVGLGKNEEGQMAIVIMVEKKLPRYEEIIPKSLEGIPTTIEEVGVIKSLDRYSAKDLNKEEEKKILGVWTDEEFKEAVMKALIVSTMIGAMTFIIDWYSKYQEKKRKS